MNNQELYNAMFHRMSVRKFSPAPLEGTQLEEVKAVIAGIPDLIPEVSVDLEVLGPTQVGRAIKSPHYVAAYGEGRLGAIHAGYKLAYLDLCLFTKGISTCYNGIAKTHKEFNSSNGLPAQMILAFGKAKGDASRGGPAAFDRKGIQEIIQGDVPLWLAEAVRVAPSGMNLQPWLLNAHKNSVDVYYVPRGVLARFMQEMGHLSVGIALCHAQLAIRQQGMECAFDFGPFQEPSVGKQELICKVSMK